MSNHRIKEVRLIRMIKSNDTEVHVSCECGKMRAIGSIATCMEWYAQHYALEMQAAKPRAIRDGVDNSTAGSPSHKEVLRIIGELDEAQQMRDWYAADDLYQYTTYTPQRVRTCLVGLVRAGLLECKKDDKYKEYRMAK